MLFVALSLLAIASADPLAADNLACEHSTVANSFFIDTPTPRLAWTPETLDRSQFQTAYQILVSTSSNVSACSNDNSCTWDSGVVYSNSTMVVYGGSPLLDDTTYYWIVRWWDSSSRQAPDSAAGTCNIAIIDQSYWNSSIWIGSNNINVVRREFTAPSGLVQARAYVSALGWGQFYLNGNLMDVGTLGVGWTKYDTRVLYLPYDITSSLLVGQNVIGVMLGHAWKDNAEYPPLDSGETADDLRDVRLIIIGTYSDGSKSVIVATDNNWVGTQSPITSDGVYNGETYDANLEQEGWSTVQFANASNWSPVPQVTNFDPILNVQSMPLIEIIREVSPVSITEPQPGVFVVDFGENLAGFCRINATGAAGTNLTLHHGEVLQHEPYGPANGLPFYGNLRTALATDNYIMKGNPQGETYQPRFTYHGFRYVQVNNYPGTLTADDIIMLHIHTAVDFRAQFATSSMIINQIQYNAVTGQGSNLMSIPTDCDQRDERLGWMGDAGLSADGMSLHYSLPAFHENFLRNIQDELDPSGFSIPDVVPFVRYGGRPADPSWSAAFPQIIWSQYKYLGDLTVAAKYYQSLLDYLSNLASQVSAAGGLVNWPTPYGDWVPPNNNQKVAGPFCSSYNYLVTISQVAELALALGDVQQYQNLTQLFEQVAAEFNTAFISGNNYANAQQIAMALPLLLGIVPESVNATALFATLVDNVVNVNQFHVTTGIIGLKGLFPALADGGAIDVAFGLAEQVDYPSLGFMAYNDLEPANGNLWELWDSPTGSDGMDSRNHHMFSSPSAWHYELAGFWNIRKAGLAPTLYLKAATTSGLSFANVSFAASAGLTVFNWQRNGGTQCGKAPENQSKVNPALPLHEPLVIDCGVNGGVITSIPFASYGLPVGYCGNYQVDSSCNLANSTSVIESLCVGKQSCEVPSDTAFWSDPCFGFIKRLAIQVECSAVDSISATVTAPVNVGSQVTLPLYGITNAVVTESGNTVWSNGQFVAGVEGVLSGSFSDGSIVFATASGTYNFVLSQAA